MNTSQYNFESFEPVHSEVNYVLNLMDIENASAFVEDEIPAHELELMKEQFEEFWLEREAV